MTTMLEQAYWTRLKLKVQGAFMSVTMWFNAAIAALAIALPHFVSSASDFLPASWALPISVVGNMLIRFFLTKKPLEAKAATASLTDA